MQTIDELRALIPPLHSLPAKPKRVILHWTGGPPTPDSADLKAYHFVVNQRTLEVVACNHPVAANMKHLLLADEYAQHTRNFNSFSIGVSMCGMLDAVEGKDFGPYPLTREQIDVFVMFVACLCVEYGIDPSYYAQVFTHYEAQTLNGVPQNHKFDITMIQFRPDLGPDEVGPWLRTRIAEAVTILKTYILVPPEVQPLRLAAAA